MPMAINIPKQLAALNSLSPAELREKYLQVFGEPSRSGNKDFLRKRLAWRIQSLAEGTLPERARQRAREIARDADIRMTLPRAAKRSAGAITEMKPLAHPASASSPCSRWSSRLPMPGTVLTRQYHGKRVEVTVLPKGFDYQGDTYRSLSAVAKVITGSHWNGYLFFGLKVGDRE